MIRVFTENGDRTDRKKARLKYLVDRWGVEKFLAETEKRLAFPLIRYPAETCEPRKPIDRAGHIGVHAQRQPGMHYIGVSVPVGRLPVAQMLALRGYRRPIRHRRNSPYRLAEPGDSQYCNRTSRAAKEALLAAGLDFSAGRVLSGTVACTGNKGCRFAATDTKITRCRAWRTSR